MWNAFDSFCRYCWHVGIWWCRSNELPWSLVYFQFRNKFTLWLVPRWHWNLTRRDVSGSWFDLQVNLISVIVSVTVMGKTDQSRPCQHLLFRKHWRTIRSFLYGYRGSNFHRSMTDTFLKINSYRISFIKACLIVNRCDSTLQHSKFEMPVVNVSAPNALFLVSQIYLEILYIVFHYLQICWWERNGQRRWLASNKQFTFQWFQSR